MSKNDQTEKIASATIPGSKSFRLLDLVASLSSEAFRTIPKSLSPVLKLAFWSPTTDLGPGRSGDPESAAATAAAKGFDKLGSGAKAGW